MKVRLVSVVVLALLLPTCGDHAPDLPEGVDHLTGPTMGTVYHIRLGRPLEGREVAELEGKISKRLAEIDSSMSTYRSDSEISQFNSSRSTDWFAVSGEFAQVVESAQEISRLTGGAFDITVGPLVKLWGFGPTSSPSADQSALPVPTAEEIAATQARTGFSHLEVRLDPPALRKSDLPELQLDLSGIAKGFAVDALAELLEAQGTTSYLVEIGGEVRVGKAKPDGSPWRIGIEAPVENERTVHRVLSLVDTALATSGDYRNFFVSGGRRYSHLIDPRTGMPVASTELGSVSILAPTCQFADSMATALFVLGSKEGASLAGRHMLDTLFLVRQGEGFSAIVTGSFEKFTRDSAQWTGN